MDDETEKNIVLIYGDVCLRNKKQRRKRQKLLVIELLFDYARNSTLHGLRYIVERGLNLVEKLFWFITVVGSIGLCSYCIHDMYIKWRRSPMIVTVNERQTSVATVPFPAVTICPQIKVNRNVYDYTAAFKMSRSDNTSAALNVHPELLLINTMCAPSGTVILEANDGEHTDVSYIHLITKVAPKLEDIFFSCDWMNTNENDDTDRECTDFFKTVYTKEGVCYTMNNLEERAIFENTTQTQYRYLENDRPSAGWSLDEGYHYCSEEHPYPRRGHVLGLQPDMTIDLIHDPSLRDKQCSQIYSGYKVYLHHPADFPQSSLYYYSSLPDKVSSLAISLHQLNTDKSLSTYSPETRQCYFPNDRPLRYFKIYTAKNCQAECLSNYTYRTCGCVGFYMPHNSSDEICSPRQKYCMSEAIESMEINETYADSGRQNNDENRCNCLPACNSVEYDAEMLQTDFNYKNMFEGNPNYNPNNSYSRLELYFKKSEFVTMQRRELFGVTDLLANIGGLLGLFLGFSFLSLVEICYFLTLRVGFILMQDLKEEKALKIKPK